MRVVFFGTPDFAVPSLEALLASRHEVVLVVSKPDKPVGRHHVMTQPPVVSLAAERGLEAIQPKNVKGQQFEAQLRGVGADVGVVVAYGRLIPASLLGVPRHGMVNVHPSLLPRHRGPSPIQWALVSGDRSTGVSTMLLDEGMDTGPVLLQTRVDIEPRETAEELAPRLARVGAELLIETLDGLEAGTLEPRPQATTGGNVTPMLRRSFGKVEWDMPARQLVNRLRGFTPWPGLFTKFRGGRLKIHGLSEMVPAPAGDEEPGTVIGTSPAGIAVRCGRGSAALITELQRDGGRRMPADAFLIGERVAPGECFG